MSYLLNIGVARAGQSNITEELILRKLAFRGKVVAHSIQHSETEDTVAALVQIPGSTADVGNVIFHLSEILEQECIAVWNMATSAGALIGPRADKWGAFNPEFFLMIDGSTLAQTLSEVTL